MRFAVLGPLSVTGTHGAIAVNGEKQRLLLAILLSRSGKPASVDFLVDALWDDRPPDIPHKRLSWHIHRLRGGLDLADRIVRNADGYALTLSESELDADDFVRLCRTAEAAETAGELTEAGEHWTAALRLWRGPAYGELGEHRELRGEAARLAGLRLRAVEHRIGVDLELGRHDELVEELRALVAEHPVRERLRGQLMLSLYRAGRKTEALEVYRDTRDALVDELGVEPGRDLRELHKDILRDAARLAAPVSPTPPAGATVTRPAELPAGTAAFTGRDADVERLKQLLAGGTPGPVVISAVTGTGGIGKSALAIRATRLMADRFPDGQLYLNLRGATPGVTRLDPAEALARLLRSLDVDVPGGVTDTDELAARFRSAVADRRLLLLLDDAADAAQVTPLLPGGANCAVVITSRNTLTQLDGAAFLRLDVLSRSDALRLFQRLTGRPESAAAVEIIELCGRMPLAICVAAARVNTDPRLPVEELAGQLRSQSRRLEQLDDGQRAVRSSFMVSYQALDADAARMFRRLALHEGPTLNATTAAALSGVPTQRAATVLTELIAAHLINETEPGRYSTHDLLRLFGRERAAADDTEADLDAAIERMLHGYLATARNALRAHGRVVEERRNVEPRQLHHPGIAIADRTAAHAWVNSERANLDGMIRQASATGRPQTGVALAVALFPNLHILGYWHQAHSLFRMAVECADTSASLPHRTLAYRDLATLELELGLFDDGLRHAEWFLEVCVESGDLAEQAMAYHLIAAAHRESGRLDAAVECLERSLELCVRTSNGQMESLVAMSIGMVHIRAGRLAEAAPVYRRAAELAQKHGEHQKHASAVCNLGHVQRQLGDAVTAMSTFDEAWSIIRSGDLAGTMIESDALWGMGDTLCDLDRVEEAKRHWNEAAEMLFRLGHITDAERRAIAASDRPETPWVLS